MNLDLSEEQRLLSTSARDFLRNECPKDLVREMRDKEEVFPRELWQSMAGLGWMGVAIPEEYGGSGGSFIDLIVLVEAMGEACLPAPFFSTVVVAATALQRSSAEALKSELLPRIAGGDLVATYARIEPGNAYSLSNLQTRAVDSGGGYRVSGRKLFVEYAQAADLILLVAQVEGKGLGVLVLDAKSPGLKIEALPTLDHAHQGEVRLDEVEIPRSRCLVLGPEAESLLKELEETAAVAKCAEMLGCVQAVLEMSVSYVKDRHQFDRPIGSFQAVQHHCANMAVEVDCCRYITRLAAWKIAQGLPAATAASMAKSYTSQASLRIAKLGHQTHGAIAFCDEHDMHLFLRRSHAASVAFGDAEYHLERVAQELGL